ncbi:hypothetical protein C5473_04250 [Leptospira interrogans serovar Weerasinghe]|nr:hypothetical protein C5473_04250 [Leptospira interrogans serovar Weerasinghe]
MLELFKLVERIRSDPFSVETLYTSVSGHATISVFKELVIPITNTLSPKIRYGVKATLISFTYRSNYFLSFILL